MKRSRSARDAQPGNPDPPCLVAALNYLEMGWGAIPLCTPDHKGCSRTHTARCKKPGKAPLVGKWQQRKLIAEELRGHWKRHPRANVGVVLGPISGLCGLDIDGPAGTRLLEKLCREVGQQIPDTVAFDTGGGGARLLLRLPDGADPPQHQWVDDQGGEVLRFQSRGGQTVMPPSIHPSGKPYRWRQDSSPWDTDVAECPLWLLDLVQRLHDAKQGRSQSAGKTEPARQPRDLDSETLELARRDLATIAQKSPAISGQGGHNQTFKVACRLVHGWKLSDGEAFELLTTVYNPHCQPPWSEAELWHKIHQAREQGSYQDLVNDPQRNESMGTEQTRQQQNQTPGIPAIPKAAPISLGSFQPQPISWLVPGYFPLGKVVLIAGDGGHGKSALTLDLAACITTGRPCFGLDYPSPIHGNVLMAFCEDDAADTVAPRLDAAGADRQRCFQIPSPFTLQNWRLLENWLEDDPNIRLVIIDPAGSYIGARIDDHREVDLRSVLSPLAEVAARRNVCIVLVKHFNRNQNSQAVNRVMGSTAYVNSVRAAFVVVPQAGSDVRLFLPIKFNLGKKPQGLTFRTRPLFPEEASEITRHYSHLSEVQRNELGTQLFRIEWLGTADTTADDALAANARHDRGPNRIEQAKEWLKEFLKEYAFPSREINDAGQLAGFTFDNIKEAKAQLKAEGLHSSTLGRFQGEWWCGFGESAQWRLRPKSGEGQPPAPDTPHSPKSPHSGDRQDDQGGGSSYQSRESGECRESGEPGDEPPLIYQDGGWGENIPDPFDGSERRPER